MQLLRIPHYNYDNNNNNVSQVFHESSLALLSHFDRVGGVGMDGRRGWRFHESTRVFCFAFIGCRFSRVREPTVFSFFY